MFANLLIYDKNNNENIINIKCSKAISAIWDKFIPILIFKYKENSFNINRVAHRFTFEDFIKIAKIYYFNLGVSVPISPFDFIDYCLKKDISRVVINQTGVVNKTNNVAYAIINVTSEELYAYLSTIGILEE